MLAMHSPVEWTQCEICSEWREVTSSGSVKCQCGAELVRIVLPSLPLQGTARPVIPDRARYPFIDRDQQYVPLLVLITQKFAFFLVFFALYITCA